jgi:hypothetical protein
VGGNAWRHVDNQQTTPVLKTLIYNQGERRSRPIKDPFSNQVGGVVRRDANEGFGPRFRLVIDTENDSPAIGIGETNCRIGQQSQGVLRALCRLLEVKLLALKIAGGHTVP